MTSNYYGIVLFALQKLFMAWYRWPISQEASQITGNSSFWSTVCSSYNKKKHTEYLLMADITHIYFWYVISIDYNFRCISTSLGCFGPLILHSSDERGCPVCDFDMTEKDMNNPIFSFILTSQIRCYKWPFYCILPFQQTSNVAFTDIISLSLSIYIYIWIYIMIAYKGTVYHRTTYKFVLKRWTGYLG